MAEMERIEGQGVGRLQLSERRKNPRYRCSRVVHLKTVPIWVYDGAFGRMAKALLPCPEASNTRMDKGT